MHHKEIIVHVSTQGDRGLSQLYRHIEPDYELLSFKIHALSDGGIHYIVVTGLAEFAGYDAIRKGHINGSVFRTFSCSFHLLPIESLFKQSNMRYVYGVVWTFFIS